MNICVAQDNQFLEQIPLKPGVYRYYDADGVLLYVGKAVNLYNRVKSYFGNIRSLSPRVRLFVMQIYSIDITITQDEQSALLLERNFILQLQPKYNILLKYDTTTPGVLLSRHEFSSCGYYRGVKSEIKNADYYPTQNSYQATNMINIIQKIYKLRNCSDITFNQQKSCLLYQIDRCSAPCIGNISREDYKNNVKKAKKLLCGQHKQTIQTLKDLMQTAAKNLEFEKATIYRDQLKILNESNYKNVFDDLEALTADIVVYKKHDEKHMYYLMNIVNGKYIADKSFTFDSVLSDNNVHKIFLEEYYVNYFEQEGIPPPTGIKVYFSEFIALDIDIKDFFNKKLQISIVDVKSYDRISDLVSMGIQNLNLIIESRG